MESRHRLNVCFSGKIISLRESHVFNKSSEQGAEDRKSPGNILFQHVCFKMTMASTVYNSQSVYISVITDSGLLGKKTSLHSKIQSSRGILLTATWEQRFSLILSQKIPVCIFRWCSCASLQRDEEHFMNFVSSCFSRVFMVVTMSPQPKQSRHLR